MLIVEKRNMTEEANMPTISVTPDETIDLEKVYYHGVYVLLQFNKEYGVNRKEDKV